MEKIVALYETMSVADAVVQDLEVARIPSVVIHRGNLERDVMIAGSEATVGPR